MEKKDTRAAPSAKWRGGGKDTLLMIDPDAPGPKAPTARNWLHWMVTNIPAGGGPADGDVVVAYAGPSPPIGNHRYVFVLYEQSAHVAASAPAARGSFNAITFAASHALHAVGLNFYYVHAPDKH